MGPAELLPYFQLAGQVALVIGAVFAGYQLVQIERTRREQMSLQTVTQFNTQEFRAAFALVNTLPIAATAEQVREADPEMERAATTVMMTFEMLGVLVFNRMLSLHILDQAIGGFLRESWRRLEKHIHQQRKEIQSPRYGEWYQWLFEHVAVDARRERGAYEVFRAWERRRA